MIILFISEDLQDLLLHEEVLNPFFLNNIEERNDISMGQEE
jgi:hypothetical protein